MKPNTRNVVVKALRLEAACQCRVAITQDVAEEYAQAYRDKIELPPIVVCELPEGDLIVVDGFHRVSGAILAGREWLPATVHAGESMVDATVLALGANQSHGLRRTNADKRRTVEMALSLPDADELSDRQIAKQCGVHHELVARIRESRASDSAGLSLVVAENATTPAPGLGASEPARRRDSRGHMQPARKTRSAPPAAVEKREPSGNRASGVHPRSAAADPLNAKIADFNAWLDRAMEVVRGARLSLAALEREQPEYRQRASQPSDALKQLESSLERTRLARCPMEHGAARCGFCRGSGIATAEGVERQRRYEEGRA
jgi:ParB-like chromosome segregation protein Spo0J